VTLPAVAHIDRELLLAGQPSQEKVAVGAFDGRAGLGDFLQSVKIAHHLRPDARLLQILRRVGVLRVDKGARLRTLRVFKPSIAVGDYCPEVIVHHRDGRNGGRRRQGDALPPMNCLSGRVDPNDCPKREYKSTPHAVPPGTVYAGKMGRLPALSE